jgi:molecular chaperone DnaK
VTAPSPLATPKPISAPRSERSVGGGGGTTAVGIDLGGAFSAIAYVNKWGVPEILHNAEGDRITPSVVLFDGDEIIVGNYAKQAAVAFPHQVVEFVKRHMGDDDYVFRYRGQDYSPEQLSSYILAKLKHDAELRLGEKIEDAVITIPAYFADKHRRATMRAGELAGLRVLKLINESTATAFAYGQSAGRSMRFMVFDLGGLYFN